MTGSQLRRLEELAARLRGRSSGRSRATKEANLAAAFRVQLDSALGLPDQFGDCDHVAFGVGVDLSEGAARQARANLVSLGLGERAGIIVGRWPGAGGSGHARQEKEQWHARCLGWWCRRRYDRARRDGS